MIGVALFGTAVGIASAGLAADLRSITDQSAAKYNCSVSLAVRSRALFVTAASGVVDGKDKAARASDPYAWGSVTKTFTGAAIMKHVAEGRLSLDEAAAPPSKVAACLMMRTHMRGVF